MVISFILHQHSVLPGGGPLVVYRYANGLSKLGHNVYVILPNNISLRPRLKFLDNAKYWARKIGIKGGYKPTKWLSIEKGVKIQWVPTLHYRYIPKSEYYVATYWKTAEVINSYNIDNSQKYYLIQGEDYVCEDVEIDRVIGTWKMPFKKIVISKALKTILNSYGENVKYIPNGLDHDSFGIDIPIDKRNNLHLLMMYNPLKMKGAADGLHAIKMIKEKYPNIIVTIYGLEKRPSELPNWVRYHRNPSRLLLRKLYNEAAIFIAPSHSEGWDLPACEAALCGAALCLTDIGGHQEYAIDGKSALMSQKGEPTKLAENIEKLIYNDAYRISLVTEQNSILKKYSWEHSIRQFETFILYGG